MDSGFIFYDYTDADGSGSNIILDWLNNDAKEAKARFNRIIGHLEASPPAGSQDSVWHPPYILPLRGEWEGFKEIRVKARRIQYRLICKIEGRNVLLVTWGYHKGNWVTDVTAKTAEERVSQMNNDLFKYGREHDNS